MERRGPYNVAGIPQELGPDLLQPAQNWRQPSSVEIKAALQMARLTGNEFAALIGVKDRTVRRWTGDEVVIPYAAWAILCHQAGYPAIWSQEEN